MKVLIVAPSLDLTKNVSGVSAVTDFIISHNKACQYEHFLQGKSDDERGAVSRVLRVFKTYLTWKKKLELLNNSDCIIHYNYPLDTPSVLRDYFFLKVAHKRKKRMVIHIHGGLYLFKDKKPFIIRRFLNEVFSFDNPFIVLSDKEKEQIQGAYHTKNVYVLPNCVDLPNVSLDGNESRIGDALHILYLGRIEPNKGMDYLYEAMKELKDKNVILHFAGIEQGANDYVRKYKELLGDKFIYEGVVAGEEKTALFRRCQVFMLPSLYEGLPMSLVESMSFGLVPVTTSVGSIGQYVKDGTNGLLLKVKDPNSIVEKTNQLLNDKALIRQLSEAARQTVLSQFNPVEYIEKLNTIYAQTI